MDLIVVENYKKFNQNEREKLASLWGGGKGNSKIETLNLLPSFSHYLLTSFFLRLTMLVSITELLAVGSLLIVLLLLTKFPWRQYVLSAQGSTPPSIDEKVRPFGSK